MKLLKPIINYRN